MFFLVIQLLGLSVLAYALYVNVIKIYFDYFYYRSQGMPTEGFPLPLLGNSLGLAKLAKKQDTLKRTVLEEFWFTCFGKVLPKIFFESMRGPNLIVNDPAIVNELYVTQNKFVDKYPKFA